MGSCVSGATDAVSGIYLTCRQVSNAVGTTVGAIDPDLSIAVLDPTPLPFPTITRRANRNIRPKPLAERSRKLMIGGCHVGTFHVLSE